MGESLAERISDGGDEALKRLLQIAESFHRVALNLRAPPDESCGVAHCRRIRCPARAWRTSGLSVPGGSTRRVGSKLRGQRVAGRFSVEEQVNRGRD
jgi:hypothetical protein